jgi:hypothetical protein
MKRNLIILSLLLLAGIIAWYFISQGRWGTIKRELKDFAVKDSADITKIFIAERGEEKVLLEKQEDGRWMVNNKFYADRTKIANLLEVIRRVEVKSPVPEAHKQGVLADMASRNTKVEIFNGDELIKSYLIGRNTPDDLGTYMLMDNSSAPFVTHIPGFNGFLSVRYFTGEKDWKTTEIFEYKPSEITSISVEYPLNKPASFVITSQGGQNSIKPLYPEGAATAGEPDTNLLKFYKEYFGRLHYEGYERNVSEGFVDSFYKSTPFSIIKVIGINGKTNELKLYYKPIDIRTKVETDEQGKPLTHDIERYYAFLNNDKDLLLVQDFAIRQVLRKYEDFFINKKADGR